VDFIARPCLGNSARVFEFLFFMPHFSLYRMHSVEYRFESAQQLYRVSQFVSLLLRSCFQCHRAISGFKQESQIDRVVKSDCETPP
jgi:hypothetical protein